MPLWGAGGASGEAKPKYLTDEQKKDCFATEKGWEVTGSLHLGNDNPDAREILVATGGLAAALDEGTITTLEIIGTSANVSVPDTISVEVTFNEQVLANTAGGTPTLELTNGAESADANSANLVLSLSSGNNTNKLVFSANLVPTSGGPGQAPTDVLTISANAISLNSGTIIDAFDGVNTSIGHAASNSSITVTG